MQPSPTASHGIILMTTAQYLHSQKVDVGSIQSLFSLHELVCVCVCVDICNLITALLQICVTTTTIKTQNYSIPTKLPLFIATPHPYPSPLVATGPPVLHLWNSPWWLCEATACSFLWPAGIPWCGWATVCVTISPAEGQLGCFRFGAIMSTAAMNIHTHIHMKLCRFSIPTNNV